jgi:hypothetical protein
MKCKKDHTCAREGCDNKFSRSKKSHQKFCREKCRLHVYFGKPQVNGPVFEKYKEKVDCLWCGKSFLKPTILSVFCSVNCRQKNRRVLERKEKGVKKEKAKCAVCNTVFERTTSPKLRANKKAVHIKETCSEECRTEKYRKDRRDKQDKQRIQITRNCCHCQTEFTIEGYKGSTYGKKYCSRACTIKANIIKSCENLRKDGRGEVNALKRRATEELKDSYIRQHIIQDFKRDGLRMSASEISPQMIEDRRLLLQAKRAWKQVTGKTLSTEGFTGFKP